MKRLYCVFFLVLAAAGRAQSGEDTIPVFDLDDYYVEPKMTLSVGFRGLSGPKMSFSGSTGITNTISSIQGMGDPDATGIERNYHDGYLLIDQRKDADGNPVADGLTNSWRMLDTRQVTEAGDAIAMHTYSAQITDNKTRESDPGNSYGAELVVARDMGKIGNRIEWRLFAGVSINNINVVARDNVLATITTLTDLYGLNGQTAPTEPYEAPSSIVNEDNSVTDTTVLLGQKPDSRTSTSVTNDTSVSSFWRLKGTYVTFRAGPEVLFKITDKFKLSVSAGPAFIYVGTNYAVVQTMLVDTADPVIDAMESIDDDVLKGYYADMNLEYSFTDRAGLYMGAFYQTSGIYNQDLKSLGWNYSARLDLNSMQGFRAGMNFKF